MKRSVIILALSFLCLSAATLMAQDLEDEERDVLELSFYSGLGIPVGGLGEWHDTLGTKTGLLFGVDGGYFLSPNLVLGINFTYGQYSVDTDADLGSLKHRFYNPSLYLKYYFFGEGNMVPYLKGSLGVDNPKFATGVERRPDVPERTRYRELSYDPALSLGFSAGMFYYTSDYSGLFLDVTYHHGLTQKSEKQLNGEIYLFGENSSVLEIHAGINVYFGSAD